MDKKFLKRETPKTLAFISGKGGTGKSIISASVGSILAHCGFKVLLIDTDFYTRGISFYLMSDEAFGVKVGLSDYVNQKVGVEQLETLKIASDFVNSNLYLLPASSKLRYFSPEVEKFDSGFIHYFQEKMRQLIIYAKDRHRFEYIILDTRGGTDKLSLLTANIAEGYVVITEADKTSWDVSELLLNGIASYSKEEDLDKRMGFVLNKNTLPERELVIYLKYRFACPGLAVIPLDIDAVRHFQNDEIPVAENIAIPFSQKIVELCDTLFRPLDYWDEFHKEKLQNLKMIIENIKKTEIQNKLIKESIRKFKSFAIPFLLITLVLLYFLLVFFDLPMSGNLKLILSMLLLFLAVVLVFLLNYKSMFFLFRGIRQLIRRKKKMDFSK